MHQLRCKHFCSMMQIHFRHILRLSRNWFRLLGRWRKVMLSITHQVCSQIHAVVVGRRLYFATWFTTISTHWSVRCTDLLTNRMDIYSRRVPVAYCHMRTGYVLQRMKFITICDVTERPSLDDQASSHFYNGLQAQRTNVNSTNEPKRSEDAVCVY